MDSDITRGIHQRSIWNPSSFYQKLKNRLKRLLLLCRFIIFFFFFDFHLNFMFYKFAIDESKQELWLLAAIFCKWCLNSSKPSQINAFVPLLFRICNASKTFMSSEARLISISYKVITKTEILRWLRNSLVIMWSDSVLTAPCTPNFMKNNRQLASKPLSFRWGASCLDFLSFIWRELEAVHSLSFFQK